MVGNNIHIDTIKQLMNDFQTLHNSTSEQYLINNLQKDC